MDGKYLVVWTGVDDVTGQMDYHDLAQATDHYRRLRDREDVSSVSLSEVIASTDVPGMAEVQAPVGA